MSLPTVLAIIPARKGSKRIPGKNSKSFFGKPLIQWTIEAAQATPAISQIIVSTDDPQILGMQSLFPKVIFKERPAELCGDEVPGGDPVLFEMSRAAKHDYVILLQPTSPLRTPQHITAALESCFNNNLNQLVSVRKPMPGDKFIIENNSQSWTLNGAIYISRWEFLLKTKKVVNPETAPFEMDANSSIDIDTPEDWDNALKIMKERA